MHRIITVATPAAPGARSRRLDPMAPGRQPRTARLGIYMAVWLFLPACGASQVQLKGDESAIVEMAGDWEGSFTGVDSGRKGTIHFSLTVDRHTADGKVLMFMPDDTDPKPLKVQFVEIDKGGQVSGKIEPYTDPQCACMVETEFLGILDGDSISGTFTTRELDGQRVQEGRWSVVRNAL